MSAVPMQAWERRNLIGKIIDLQKDNKDNANRIFIREQELRVKAVAQTVEAKDRQRLDEIQALKDELKEENGRKRKREIVKLKDEMARLAEQWEMEHSEDVASFERTIEEKDRECSIKLARLRQEKAQLLRIVEHFAPDRSLEALDLEVKAEYDAREASSDPPPQPRTEPQGQSAVGGNAAFEDEGRCYMMDTPFKTPAGNLIAAADLSIGAEVLDHSGSAVPVTWCRKLPKRKRLLVDLHTNPFTVTGSHRIVVPGGDISQAKALRQNDEVLIGGGCQRLLKATTRYGNLPVMELEFQGDAIVEVHARSILTKGSDPSQPIDENGLVKCKEDKEDQVMARDSDQPCDGSIDLASGSTCAWPDTDDDFK